MQRTQLDSEARRKTIGAGYTSDHGRSPPFQGIRPQHLQILAAGAEGEDVCCSSPSESIAARIREVSSCIYDALWFRNPCLKGTRVTRTTALAVPDFSSNRGQEVRSPSTVYTRAESIKFLFGVLRALFRSNGLREEPIKTNLRLKVARSKSGRFRLSSTT